MTSDENVADEGRERAESTPKNELIEVAIGVAMLGLGAAVLSGRRGGIGGIVRTVAQGPTQRTPPIVPAHLRHVHPSLWRNPPTV
jgi:hypothetical protein